MAFSIKNPEADLLARELAATTGESLTEAVLVALRERLEREQRRKRPLTGRLLAVGARNRHLPVLDDRSAEEILGYDERGLPR